MDAKIEEDANLSYEERRDRNIDNNRRLLESLGLHQFYLIPTKKTQGPKPRPPKKRKEESISPIIEQTEVQGNKRRKSSRLLAQRKDDKEDNDHPQEEVVSVMKSKIQRVNTFGHIEGVTIGTTWNFRMECSATGIHRPTVAGIHGSETEGAYSVALSGGYEDDVDLGYSFTFTGEGGRDLTGTKSDPKNLRTAPQSKNQSMTKGNLALARSCETGIPVRVIRGFKCPSIYAPESGYRYDGLYIVKKFWSTVGLSGFEVFKYALFRCPDQDPPAWENLDQKDKTIEVHKE